MICASVYLLVFIKNLLMHLAEKILLMQPLTFRGDYRPNNKKDPGGLSGFVLIAESHISIHRFPRRGFVTADVYSCQDDLDGVRLEHAFTKALGATSCETFEVIRGRHYPAADVED